MADVNRLRTIVLEVAAESSPIDLSTIDEDADLYELGFDSLEFATVLVEVEDRLGEELPAEAFDRLAELERPTLRGVLTALATPVAPRLP
jgi:acyl carrier protein